MPLRLDQKSPDFEAAFQRLLDVKRTPGEDVTATVADILADVRARGDVALAAYTKRFDDVALAPDDFRVTPAEFAAAEREVGPDLRCALEFSALRIEDYHRRQLPEDLDYLDEAGVRLGYRWRPLGAVGVYVPGGTAVYPSSVLMNAVPARIAGVERIVMTVPTPKGVLNPLLLVAAKIAGVTEVYRLGGAQAIAALAYGTEKIGAVDKIVGPGNVYVAEAKRQVFGQVGIDMIAGPSEILILADGANDPDWIAADLLSQAEHDPAAQAILVTDDPEFCEKVERAIEDALQSLARADIARASWKANGVLLSVDRLEDAIPLIDRLAPEHLELAIEDADVFATRIRNAGAIFIGRFTPEALGDYVAGPNHVLPTARSARFSSGLGVLDFLKRSSFVACSEVALDRLAPAAEALATAEGLDAHARSLCLRMGRSKDG